MRNWIRPAVFYFGAGVFFLLTALGLTPVLNMDWPHLLSALVGASLSLVAANPAMIEAIKLPGGFEARTRAVVRQAEVTLNELQRMSEILGCVLVDRIAAEGRWGGGGASTVKEQSKERVLEMMRTVGLSQSAIERVSAADRQWVIIDYVREITRNVTVPPEKAKWWREEWAPFEGGYERPNPDILAKLIAEVTELDDRQREWLADYRYYHEHSRHRRPQVWQARP